MPSTIRKAKNAMTYFRVLSILVKNLSIYGYLPNRGVLVLAKRPSRAGAGRAGVVGHRRGVSRKRRIVADARRAAQTGDEGEQRAVSGEQSLSGRGHSSYFF